MDNECMKTRFYSTNFIRTWVIEGFKQCQDERWKDSLGIVSPKFYVRPFEFQLKVNPKRSTECSKYYFNVYLKVLSCPINETHIRVTVCPLTAAGIDSEPHQESILNINRKNTVFTCYELYDTHSPYQYVDLNGNLTIKCTFTFRNSVSCIENLETTTALSKSTIIDDYEELFNAGKFSDVTIVVRDKKFLVHKSILSVRSPVFAAMFEHDMLEKNENVVEITDIAPEAMREALRFIYTGKVNDIEKFTADLFAAADKYELKELMLKCEDVLMKKPSLENLEEALKIIGLYETCPRLHEAVLEFLTFHGSKVASWEKFDEVMKTLSPSLLLEVTKATMLKY